MSVMNTRGQCGVPLLNGCRSSCLCRYGEGKLGTLKTLKSLIEVGVWRIPSRFSLVSPVGLLLIRFDDGAI